jgi:hypothetical protein
VSFNIAIIFDFNLLPVPLNNAQFKGNAILNRQNAAISSRGVPFQWAFSALIFLLEPKGRGKKSCVGPLSCIVKTLRPGDLKDQWVQSLA